MASMASVVQELSSRRGGSPAGGVGGGSSGSSGSRSGDGIGLFSTLPVGGLYWMGQAAKSGIGAYVRKHRRDLNLSQGELGDAWGKSQSTVSEVELGKRPVDREDVRALSRALGRPFAEVMEAAGYIPDDSDAEGESEEGVLKMGSRYRLLAREGGGPGVALVIDEQTLAILEAIARSQDRGEAGR